ncbi:molybdate ABC transporter substrate-binding protein [Aestuariivirga sp.]|uniref:molybdate ABC transporter substrate-binding protein n=1 Tax=Aestuariivirga sp. TaxID=2650926 RepID=UPI003594343B
MISRRTLGVKLVGAIALMVLAAVGPASAADGKITVFAAASLKNALDEVSAAWKAETGKETTNSYAASSALARQIEEGAPADVFMPADLDWMTYLMGKGLMKSGTEVKLLGNAIVLVAPKDSSVVTTIEKGFPLAEILSDGTLAIGDVKAVPAGKYGKAALEMLGVWASVEGNVAQAENVRAALKFVATGEAALGIVYQTDAIAEPAVKIVGIFPANSHEPIIYPVASVASSTNPDAAAFLAYMQSPKAQELFRKQGFTILASGN